MDFSPNKPIYRQIAEYCYARIMDGEWTADGRIPSVKELAMNMAVNPRTVIKAYDDMQALGIIYQKRGLGYFVSPEASGLIQSERRAEFLEMTVPELVKEMKLAGITPDELHDNIVKLFEQ